MTLEQAITIKTLGEFYNLGQPQIESCEDDNYKVVGLRCFLETGGIMNFTANKKSFTQSYSWIKGVTK